MPDATPAPTPDAVTDGAAPTEAAGTPGRLAITVARTAAAAILVRMPAR
jgi:hypothetical protein